MPSTRHSHDSVVLFPHFISWAMLSFLCIVLSDLRICYLGSGEGRLPEQSLRRNSCKFSIQFFFSIVCVHLFYPSLRSTSNPPPELVCSLANITVHTSKKKKKTCFHHECALILSRLTITRWKALLSNEEVASKVGKDDGSH